MHSGFRDLSLGRLAPDAALSVRPTKLVSLHIGQIVEGQNEQSKEAEAGRRFDTQFGWMRDHIVGGEAVEGGNYCLGALF